MNTTQLQKQILKAIGSILLAVAMFFTWYTQASAAPGDLIWSIDSAGDNFSDAAADATGVYTGRSRYGYFFYTVTDPWIQKWSPNNGALISTVTSVAPYGVRYVSFDGSDNIKISMWGGSWEIRRKSDLGLVSVYIDPDVVGSVSSNIFDVNDLAVDNNAKMRNVYDSYSNTSLSLEQNVNYTGFSSSWPSYLQIEAATAGVVNRAIYSIPKVEWMTAYNYGPYTIQGSAAQLWYGPYSMEPDDLGNVYIVGGSDQKFDVGRIQKREAPPPYAAPVVRFIDVTAFTYGAVYGTVSKGDVISVGWDSDDTTSCSVVSGADSGFKTGNATEGFDTTVTPIYDKTVFTVECIATDGTILTASDTVTVTGGIGVPDLYARNYDIPSIVNAGIPTTLSASIYNSGTADTSASFPYFFQVAGGADGKGVVSDLPPSTHPVLSNSGSVSPKNESYTFPTAGTYSVRACADQSSSAGGGVIVESDESNNCSTWANVTVSLANLTASPVTPTSTFALKTTTFSATISNNGVVSTGKGFANKIQLASSAGGSGVIQDITAGFTPSGALASGASAVASISYIFTTAGTYSMRVCTDTTSVIPETNEDESDNCSPWTDVDVTDSLTPILPTATLSATDCVIPKSGALRSQDWCYSSIKGDIVDALSPNFYNETTGTTYVTGSSINWAIAVLTYGTHTIQARNDKDVIMTVYATAACEDGSTWDGEYCVDSATYTPPTPATGDIWGTNCQIPLGASSCPGSVSWKIENASDPNVFDVEANSEISSAIDEGTMSVTLNEGTSYVFQARDGFDDLDSVTLSATCDASSDFWNGTACGLLPSIEVTAEPNIIRSGQTTEINVTINSLYPFTCKLYGAEADPADALKITHDGSGEVVYPNPTRALTSDQEVMVVCDVLSDNSVVVTEIARVQVVGTVEEI